MSETKERKALDIIEYAKMQIVTQDPSKIKKDDREANAVLYQMLRNAEYTIRAIKGYTDEIDENVEHVYIFDKNRSMFWKGMYGYTLSIENAGLFPIDKAKEIVNESDDNVMINFNY